MGQAQQAEANNELEPLDLDVFYCYGFDGREMLAARAPSAMSEQAEGLMGRTLRFNGALYSIVAVRRQIRGPIAKNEPVGLEVELKPVRS